jgi:hypothetical protein
MGQARRLLGSGGYSQWAPVLCVSSVTAWSCGDRDKCQLTSLRAQRLNRAQASGAPSWNQARGEHDRREHDGNRHERHEVQWRDFEEDTGEKSAHTDRQ